MRVPIIILVPRLIFHSFLYAGIFAVIHPVTSEAIKDYFVITLLWQVLFGIFVGLAIGTIFNRLVRISEARNYIDDPGMIVFYLLLAVMSVGVGSTLGSDDFLVAFGAGYGFARDGWFRKKTKKAHLPHVIDLLLNSSMFIYLGTIIPWNAFGSSSITPTITLPRLFGFTALVLLFRRIPVMLALYRWIPDIRTSREAIFCGHFGPMGLGGLFLAIEGRAMLETDSALPLPHPPLFQEPFTRRERAIKLIWPIVCFVVICSTFVHGLSVLALSIGGHFRRDEAERAPLLGGETDPLQGMVHDEGGGESEPDSDDEDASD